MDESLKENVGIIHDNLLDLIDRLNDIGLFVDCIGDISKGFESNGRLVELNVIFSDIRNKIYLVSEQIEDNLKGLKMTTLD